AVALVMILMLIWTNFWRIENFVIWMGTTCVFAVGLPHIGLLSLARLNRNFEWIRYGTVVVVALLAAMIIGMIWVHSPGDDAFRIMGVIAILDACGTIAVPVLHRVSAIRTHEAIQTSDLTVALTCPRCSSAQTLAVGRSKCAKCGLRF